MQRPSTELKTNLLCALKLKMDDWWTTLNTQTSHISAT